LGIQHAAVVRVNFKLLHEHLQASRIEDYNSKMGRLRKAYTG
jgi:hypothetical protein